MKINNIKIWFFIGVSLIVSGVWESLKNFPALCICFGISILLGVFMRLISGIYEKVMHEENQEENKQKPNGEK